MDIVVRAPNWIGDCIMSLPALRALKDNCPADNIILVIRQHLSEVYRNIEDIKEIITIPEKTNFRNFFAAAGRLRRFKFNSGILFTNSFNSALLFRLSGIKKLTGCNKDLRGFLLSKKLKFPGNEDKRHHVFFYQDIIEAFLGKKIKKTYSDTLSVSADEKQEAGQLLTSKFGVNLSRTIIGISPSAAYGSAKQWLPERFGELMQRISREQGECGILLFGSGKEREKISKIMDGIRDRGNITNLAGELTLRQAIVAISFCRVFISNDSGLMHVASSLRIPLVAIFGPTLPHKTSPLFPGAKIFHHPVECAPCKYRDCPLDHRCMKAVTVDDVYDAVINNI